MTDFFLNTTSDGSGVTMLEFARGDNNFFSEPMLSALADTLETYAADPGTRVVVLCSAGRHFCAGAQLSASAPDEPATGKPAPHVYDAAVRLFRQPLPVVAAVQGAAIGGGLGLAMTCDFRVAGSSAWFAAPFARLGLHQGFGLSETLPLVIGHQRASELLLTGRRIDADTAVRYGLCDELAENDDLRETAYRRAREIAEAAPLAVRAIRTTLRRRLIARIETAIDAERREQERLKTTADYVEGVHASRDRRLPEFRGR